MLTRIINGDSIFFYDKNQLFLTIEETDTDNGILMALKGELRSDIAHHIQDELDAFTTIGIRTTIDFNDVVYITASILNALLNSQQLVDYLRQGEIILTNIPDSIYQEMDDIGITELLLIEN